MQNAPKLAQTIYSILNQLGVEEAEPKVLHQLMEFVFRTTSDYLELASIYAEHAGRDLEVSDVQLAIQNKSQIEFVGPPPRELMTELAQETNKKPLPIIDEKFGIRLPPERYCRTLPNYCVTGKLEKMPEDLEQKPSSKLDSNIPSSMIPPLGITSFPLNEVKNPWKSDVLQDDDYDMI